MSNRSRSKHDVKDTFVQIKGKTTRKLLDNQQKGIVDYQDQQNREGGTSRTDRNPKK